MCKNNAQPLYTSRMIQKKIMKFVKSTKNLSCSDVVSCVFDLNDLDLNVYKKLREIGESRTDTLAKKLKKEARCIDLFKN